MMELDDINLLRNKIHLRILWQNLELKSLHCSIPFTSSATKLISGDARWRMRQQTTWHPASAHTHVWVSLTATYSVHQDSLPVMVRLFPSLSNSLYSLFIFMVRDRPVLIWSAKYLRYDEVCLCSC